MFPARHHGSRKDRSAAALIATVLLIYVLAVQGVLSAFASARGPIDSAGLDHGIICSTQASSQSDGGAPDNIPDGGAGHCLLCPVGCHLASAGLAAPIIAYVAAVFSRAVEPASYPYFAVVANFPPGWAGSRSSRAPPSEAV